MQQFLPERLTMPELQPLPGGARTTLNQKTKGADYAGAKSSRAYTDVTEERRIVK